MDNTKGTFFYDSILSRIQGNIEVQATNLYTRVRNTISISIDDLIQEGMIGAWKGSMNYDESKVANENSLNAYCMKWARGEMLYFIEKHKRELSLEAYLEVQTERGIVQRDIEDKSVKVSETPEHKRQFVITALKKIGAKQRIAIMAAFKIEDEQGNIATEGNINMSYMQYRSNKSMGLRKLRTIYSQVQNDKPAKLEACLKLLRQDHTIKLRDLMRLGYSERTASRAIAQMKRMLVVSA